MLKLFCLIVGVAGDTFSVEVDEMKKVDTVKDAIKKKKPNRIKVPWQRLQLFLAKTSDGAWLPDDDALNAMQQSGADTSLFKKMIGSWRLNTEELFGPGISLGENVVHVLVVVPTSVSVDEPLGSEVDLDSCDDLLAFLESDMADKEAIISRPHILTDESLDFRLVGREQAIDTASECFNNIIKNAKNAALDRTQVAMPVCSGISGLGKTRMLEEGGKILQQVTKLDPKHVVSVIVPYCDGFNPEPVEQSMSIQASFSWRLLYRFFLDYNCSHSFQEWFTWRLPSNGGQLSLQSAVKVIERKLRKKLQEPAALLYLFLGVDDYEKIERVGARQNGSKTSILRELVEIIASLVCTQSSSLILLPMFAGKDLGAIEFSSIANSSNYVTKRLPMGLLSMQQVFRIAMSNRKRQFGKFQPCHAKDYIDKLSVCPDFLVARGARFVGGIMDCVSPSNLEKFVVPDDCFILSQAGTELFHGTLAYHPACSPVISINSACKTALETVLQGSAKEVDQVVGEIVRKRKEPSGGFRTSGELVSFIKTKQLKVQLDDQYVEF
ncbi:hypothetical protein PR003_g6953 [Phytophthora rubi]|uniref:Crinkler effector protein N-terminal domain-containing protein n=1 Tax=Phytophthora rubi TaxID=129364 RepID=A0A6A4FFC4_9STRA|nr:hypothetical protein PR003_g6953 [Phytophthora rubi]